MFSNSITDDKGSFECRLCFAPDIEQLQSCITKDCFIEFYVMSNHWCIVHSDVVIMFACV